MPSIEIAALPRVLIRALIVAIAHLPILIFTCCAVLVWTAAVLRPTTHSALALRLLRELHTWSRDVIGAASRGRAR